jgi:hypothetical protein
MFEKLKNLINPKKKSDKTSRTMLKVDNATAFLNSYDPARKEGESFKDYKKRQKEQSMVLKWLRRRRKVYKLGRNGEVSIQTIP